MIRIQFTDGQVTDYPTAKRFYHVGGTGAIELHLYEGEDCGPNHELPQNLVAVVPKDAVETIVADGAELV